jgi:glutathione synthase/RimK-type ligase-like ATP-grasp enzyme
VYVGSRSNPRIAWEFEKDALVIDGREVKPKAVFIRYDVFTSMADRRPATGFRAAAWFTTISGWALTHPDVRMFNRASARENTNKLEALRLARDVGLEIPRTIVSNDRELLESWSARGPLIAKPVNGGDFTRELPEIMSVAPQRDGAFAAPSFIQERLVPPEVRIYWIAGRTFAFNVVADALDYRSTADCKVLALPDDAVPREITEGLERLMERLRMDFGAADFKTCPETGRLRFLELNNGPMFAAFDAACGGRLTLAMADFLSAP